jgi:RNA polymerase sigma-70 factor (ECF subfamily)
MPASPKETPERSKSFLSSEIQKQEELALLHRVLDGNEKAWVTFCQRYEPLIVGCVLKVLRRFSAPYSQEDRADLVAEVWLTLLRDDRRKLRLFDPSRGYRLASWLGLLATNCTIDQLRLRSAGTTYLEDLASSDHLLVDRRYPDRDLEAQEHQALAREALGRLSVEERQFVLSCFRDERPPADLARDLGIAVNTVYSRKFKIREKLVRMVEELDRPNRSLAMAA